jgi:hypothetical protein
MRVVLLVLKILNDMFTQSDNKTFCPVRILGTLSLFHYLFLSQMELIKHAGDFSLTDMATGISILLGVISASISLKNNSDK